VRRPHEKRRIACEVRSWTETPRGALSRQSPFVAWFSHGFNAASARNRKKARRVHLTARRDGKISLRKRYLDTLAASASQIDTFQAFIRLLRNNVAGEARGNLPCIVSKGYRKLGAGVDMVSFDAESREHCFEAAPQFLRHGFWNAGCRGSVDLRSVSVLW
jgi:hypothetical protein